MKNGVTVVVLVTNGQCSIELFSIIIYFIENEDSNLSFMHRVRFHNPIFVIVKLW